MFHATGTGGQSMEKLVDSGLIAAVLDMTTTEIADHVVGGVFSAGPDRLGAIARTRCAVRRFGRRRRHGQLRSPRHGPAAVQRPSVARSQPAGHADAHDAGRERRDRAFHRRGAQPLRRTRSLPPAGGWRLADRRPGPAVPRPRCRRRPVRYDRTLGDGRPATASSSGWPGTSTTRRSAIACSSTSLTSSRSAS